MTNAIEFDTAVQADAAVQADGMDSEVNPELGAPNEQPTGPFVVQYGRRFYILAGELPNGVVIHRDVTDAIQAPKYLPHQGEQERTRRGTQGCNRSRRRGA